MILGWTQNGWEDYLFWQENDRKILKRINKLIQDVLRNSTSLEGIGKPERLKENLSGLMSRRIDEEHRLVYEPKEKIVIIHQCRFHYGS
jgi:toxin YoeB